MVHFIFLQNKSHLKESHKTSFTIFGSQKQEIWFLQESQKSGIWIKGRRENKCHWQRTPRVRFFFLTAEATLAGDFSATARSPAKPRASWPPDPNDSIDHLLPTAEPPEMACRRPWPLGGGARRYAGALKPVERDLGFPTAPVDYGEAS